MRITRTTKSPVITKENTAAGPAALMTTPLPTKRPAPMTPPSAIIVMCRCFRLRRRAGTIEPMLTGEWRDRGDFYGKIRSQNPRGLNVSLLREARLALSGRRAPGAAAGFFRLSVGLRPRRPAQHRGDDFAHRRDRCVRGLAVQHSRTRRRLAGQGRTVAAMDRAACAPLAVGGRARRQRRADRPAKPAQATGARRQFRHAAAMGLPSQHARAKLELLSR